MVFLYNLLVENKEEASSEPAAGAGSILFKAYQGLLCIWNHPGTVVLKAKDVHDQLVRYDLKHDKKQPQLGHIVLSVSGAEAEAGAGAGAGAGGMRSGAAVEIDGEGVSKADFSTFSRSKKSAHLRLQDVSVELGVQFHIYRSRGEEVMDDLRKELALVGGRKFRQPPPAQAAAEDHEEEEKEEEKEENDNGDDNEGA